MSEFQLEAIPPSSAAGGDNERCMTVKCDVLPVHCSAAVVAEVEELKPTVNRVASRAIGSRWAGRREEQEKGFKSIVTGRIGVDAGNLARALVVQLQQPDQADAGVVRAVPFGMVGGLMGPLLFNVPLGFFAD